MTLENIYRQLFAENCEAAEPEYLEWFEYEFDPDEVDWANSENSKDAMCRLVDELCDVGYDRDTLIAEYGLVDLENNSKAMTTPSTVSNGATTEQTAASDLKQQERLKALEKENEELRANVMILEQALENHHNEQDVLNIMRLVSENDMLKKALQVQEAAKK